MPKNELDPEVLCGTSCITSPDLAHCSLVVVIQLLKTMLLS
jgi:hypothetical protein